MESVTLQVLVGVLILLIGAAIVGLVKIGFSSVSFLKVGQKQITDTIAAGFSEMKVAHAHINGRLDNLDQRFCTHEKNDDERFEKVDSDNEKQWSVIEKLRPVPPIRDHA